MSLSTEARWTQKALALVLTPPEEQGLQRIAASRTAEARSVERARILLLAAQGMSNQAIAATVGVGARTVRTWRGRFRQRRERAPEQPVSEALQDEGRSGAPDKFTAEEVVGLLALATTAPQELGIPVTHWSVRELAEQAVKTEVVASIHYSTVSRYLSACELRPHKVKEWMNRKADPEFDDRAGAVKDNLAEAVSDERDPSHATVSFDEKTSIQALERIAKDKPMQPGRPALREFEYRRHGTLCLLAMMLVHTGQIFWMLNPTRTNDDTATVLHLHLGFLLMGGFKRITVVLDQLNTHVSLEVVRVVALLCGLPEPDPATLETMAQRRAWLERRDKLIVFQFTPKHASWLNPIELWFGVLARKVIRRGNFTSLEDLRRRLEEFMHYYNENLAHPYRLRRLKERSDRRTA